MEPQQKLILTLDGVHKAFGGLRAVDGVDLSIARRELRAIIGPNGAGKTTLFHVITGHLPADGGRIRLNAEEIAGLPPSKICGKGVSRTFQITSIFRRLSCLQNVQVAALAHHRRTLEFFSSARRQLHDECLGLLEQVGLQDLAGHSGGGLSHGDQKRLELAIALANQPQLLMLDEPTAGMAPKERSGIMRLIETIAEERTLTVLFTEHDMDVVFSTARRISVMHQGRILAEGKPDEIRHNDKVQEVYLGQHMSLRR